MPHVNSDLYLKVSLKGAIKAVSFDLDHLIAAFPTSASILDIITASGRSNLPNQAFAEDDEAGGSKIVGYQLDALLGSLWGSGPVPASVLDMAAASGSMPLPNEAVLKVALEDNFEEDLEEDAFNDVPSEVDRLLGASPLFGSVCNILVASGGKTLPEESQEQAALAGFSDANCNLRQTQIYLFQELFLNFFSCLRPRKGYLSPALIWLEEEGLPSAEKEAVEGEMDKEAVMGRALGKWKRLSVEEKEVWRKRAKECAKTDKK